MQIAEQHGVGEAVFQEKPCDAEAASYRPEGGRRTCTLEKVLNAQAMLTHADDDLNDHRVSLGLLVGLAVDVMAAQRIGKQWLICSR